MKKILIIGLLLICSISLFAREKIAQNEKNTYRYLSSKKIVTNKYSEVELNDFISKIDAMSLTIASYSKLNKDKASKLKVAQKLNYLYKDLSLRIDEAEFKILGEIEKRDYQIEKLQKQADLNVWLWVIAFVGLII